MNALPILDASLLNGSEAQRRLFTAQLLSACAANGCFYLDNHGISPDLCDAVLSEADAFFQMPEVEKNLIHIRNSGHFRGYSQMKNVRDWREQLHFGPELPEYPLPGERPVYEQLAGKNLWPEKPGLPFQETILNFMEAAGELGGQLLALLAEGLEQESEYFERLSQQKPYNLLKLICYYPQPKVTERSGVAPHCDWSWLTILLQDETGGLEVMDHNGKWQEVAPRKNALFINVGELLPALTNGYLRATPHQVINPSEQKKRLSVPVFINPALDAIIRPLALGAHFQPLSNKNVEAGHIHRVIRPDADMEPFVFGDSEWNRKGLGKWCYNPDCLKE